MKTKTLNSPHKLKSLRQTYTLVNKISLCKIVRKSPNSKIFYELKRNQIKKEKELLKSKVIPSLNFQSLRN